MNYYYYYYYYLISNFRSVLNVVCFLLGDSRRLNFICRRFGTICLFHLHRQIGACRIYMHLPAYEDGTECSETSAYKLQTPGNHPKTHLPAYEDGTDRVFWNVGIYNSDPGESSKRKHTTIVNYVDLQHFNSTPLSPLIVQLPSPESKLFCFNFLVIYEYYDGIACRRGYCSCTN